MRAKSMVLLLIALGCGLIASIGISQIIQPGSRGVTLPQIDTVEIFVATTDINISDKLDASNVRLEKWPIDKVPDGALKNLTQIEGRYAGARLFSGEPIVSQRLLDTDNSHATTIPDGYRVTAIKVTMDTAVANLIRPGDRVDVIGFFRKSQDVPVTSTRAILRSVRIFSVNSDTARERGDDGKVVTLKTVSLLVKDDQVEPLMLAAELGQLRLSLRRPDDQGSEDSRGVATTDKLFQSGPQLAEDARPAPRVATTPEPTETGNALLEALKAASQSAPPVQLAQGGPAFKMLVCTPDGVEVFKWQDRDQLPEGLAPLETILPALPDTGAAHDDDEAKHNPKEE